MGSVYQRKDSRLFWIAYLDHDGRRILKSAKTTDYQKAARLLEVVERRIAAEKAAGVVTGPLTFKRFAETWLKRRFDSGLISARVDRHRLHNAYPVLGSLELKEIRPHHLKELMRHLERAKKPLAPRTRFFIYMAVSLVMSDAVADELIPSNPCVLKRRRGELPAIEDRDPAWRATAIFTRDEVERLISTPELPLWRRTFYALLFLTGMRVGEAVIRRWRDYDTATEPLGQLSVHSHWDITSKRELAATKTGVSRQVPVHPTLAAMLAEWRLRGWAEHMGRKPKDEDFICTSERGCLINPTFSLKQFHRDLDALGMRRRRQHDARRTFISLAQVDGADRFKLKVITHGQPKTVMDLYTTLPWPSLCEQVSLLKIQRRRGVATALLRRS